MRVLGPRGGLLRVVWVVCLLAPAVLGAGCLFPPVATPVESDIPTTGIEGEDQNGTTVYEQHNFLRSQQGKMERGLSVEGTEHGSLQHVFDLPERLDVVRVYVTWNHTVYDLDFSAILHEAPDQEPLWKAENRNGGPGEPDSPADLEVSDRSKIFRESPTQLQVTVSAKAGADVSYSVMARGTFLCPVSETDCGHNA